MAEDNSKRTCWRFPQTPSCRRRWHHCHRPCHHNQKLSGNARSRKGQPESSLCRVLEILLSNGVLGESDHRAKKHRKGDSHIEDFLSCSGDFFHFMLDGLRMRVRRKMATRREDGGGTFMVPPVTRALLAAKSLAAGRSDSMRQDQSSKIKSWAIKNSVRNWKVINMAGQPTRAPNTRETDRFQQRHQKARQ